VIQSRPGPSLRARLVRRAFIVALRLLRHRSGGLPPPEAPFEQLDAYVQGIRSTSESLLSRIPAARDVEVGELAGSPVPGLVVRTGDGAPIPTGRSALAEWLAAAPRLVLHLHGGGYFMGSPTTHRGLAAAIGRSSGAVVVLPDYRLVPEHPYPAALDDAEATFRWLVETCGVEPARVAVVGDSAGGGLAAALIVRLRASGAPLPACYVGMSPWLDLAGTGESVERLDGTDPWIPARMLSIPARFYAGERALDDPEVSPLYADLAGFPPTLLYVGGHEVLLDDALRFVDRARAAGSDASVGVFPGLWHVFPAFPGLPEARDAIAELGGFVRRHTLAAAPADPRGDRW
jgi:epsilon-lactone hydrolase